MNSYRISFDGQILQPAFWLYVWRVTSSATSVFYVGRTGDKNSGAIGSPFSRMCAHLGSNEANNALTKKLRAKNLSPYDCQFELVALGPFYSPQKDREEHSHLVDLMDALETVLAEKLKGKHCDVVSTHPSILPISPEFEKLLDYFVNREFPDL